MSPAAFADYVQLAVIGLIAFSEAAGGPDERDSSTNTCQNGINQHIIAQ